MSVDAAQVRQLLVGGMPPGSEDLWDFRSSTVVGRLFSALAAGHKATAHDFLELQRREGNPLTIVSDIPDWEQALSLSQSATALFGTPDQRRGQVLSSLRQSAEATFDNIRAIVQPFFNYADPAQIQILEADREALRAAHTYAGKTLPLTIGAGGVGVVNFQVPDEGRVSRAGAWLFLNVDSNNLILTSFTLRGPISGQASWSSIDSGVVTAQDYSLPTLQLLDEPAGPGAWELTINCLGTGLTLNSASLFLEGQGYGVTRLEGLGGVVHTWAVVFDASKVAPGATSDLPGAYLALRRIKPAHTSFTLTLAANGQAFAIPDTDSAIPDQGIPE